MAINRHVTVAVPQGSNLSEGFSLDTGNIVGLLMPNQFSGNTIAFEILRPTDGEYLPHYDSLGHEIQIAVGPARSVALDDEVKGLPTRGFMRLRTAAAQAQTAEVICVITEAD